MLHPSRLSLSQVAFLGGALATTATLSLTPPVGYPPVHAAWQDSPKAVVDEVWQIVNDRYADDKFNQAEWQSVRQSLLSRNYTSREQAYVAIREALKQLGDPYTRFFDPQQYQVLNEETISGELSGVGIQLQLDEKTKQLTIVKVLENSPALAAKLQAGDQIVAIDGKPTKGMSVEQASRLIRGKVGSPVVLRLKRRGRDNFDVKVTRATIQLQNVSYELKQEGTKRVGYIRLLEFSATTPQQMRQAIQTLTTQNADGFVLDLRGNPGGLMLASVEIARMWMDTGLIVREVERSQGSIEFKANQSALTRKPLAVLVDGDSASASEILAGALKDNKRALIVGSKTYGKALVQLVYPLSDGSGIAVTVGRYFIPSGVDINQKGILPDVQIDLTTAQQKQLATNPTLIGTPSDPQYARAIAVLNSNFFTAESSQSRVVPPGKS